MILVCILILSGCAGIGSSKEEIMQYNGTGSLFTNPCLFGGVDQESDERCARLNFGEEGYLMHINQRVISGLASGDNCVVHTERVISELKGSEYIATRYESCPPRKTPCHANVLVKTPSGDEYILDNSAIITNAYGVSGVAKKSLYDQLMEE